ncbi:hypothetical protein BGX31_002702 [Mortierella sp. GBA43]|nr:hypothetical protein BGX31_002702 [Mortierella sp. GBA43]
METVTFVSTPAPSSSSTQPAATVGSKKNKSRASKDDALVPPAAKAPTKASRKGERIAFELDDVLRKYSPEQFKTCKAYDVGGVNILNKKPVDSRTALDKIKRRRETHNRVERRRRDCINQLIEELTSLLPRDDDDSQSKCHRVNVLRTAVAHIQTLTQQNEDLARKLGELQASTPTLAPAIITTPPRMHYDDRNQLSSNITVATVIE